MTADPYPYRSLRRVALALALLSTCGPVLLAQQHPKRIWTNQQGRTVEATLVGMAGSDVVLQLPNGTLSTISLTTLSQADQLYMQTLPSSSTTPQLPTPSPAVATPTATAPVAASANGSLAWPQEVITVDPKTIVVTPGKQDAAARQYHYQSGHFEFICNAPLAGSVMSEVASDFELVRTAFSKLPWGWEPLPKEGNHYQIYLTETPADYIAMGGDERTASGSKDGKNFMRFSALGLKKVGSRYQYDARQKEPGRVANITSRALLWDVRGLFSPWTLAGIENFMRHLAYQSNGSMKFTDLDSFLKKEIKELMTSSGSTPDLPRMLAYMHEPWGNNGNNMNSTKGMFDRKLDSLLLIYYFAYLDGDGSGSALHHYCRDIFQAAANRSRAKSYAEQSKELMDKLLAGRTDAQFSAEMIEKFGKLGIRLGN